MLGPTFSDSTPMKPSNKCCGVLQCAERVEERGLNKENLFSEPSFGHKAREGSEMVSPKQALSGKRRIRPRVSPSFRL